MMRARFAGVGGALPAQRISNEEVESHLGLEPGWIEGRTGVVERRRLAPSESLVDLAEQAARNALSDAGLAPSDIDQIVVATTSGPYLFPSMGVFCMIVSASPSSLPLMLPRLVPDFPTLWRPRIRRFVPETITRSLSWGPMP